MSSRSHIQVLYANKYTKDILLKDELDISQQTTTELTSLM
jgi:NAD(P)H-flavin reductase